MLLKIVLFVLKIKKNSNGLKIKILNIISQDFRDLSGGILWIEFIFPHEEKIEYSRSKYVDSQTELVLNVSSEKMDGYWQYTSTIEKFSVGIN